ncbi:MAG: GHKL domain-containing protein [Clostridiales bacterium]|nr:GHKL domain-containing protein [Clostridiales bacterium]
MIESWGDFLLSLSLPAELMVAAALYFARCPRRDRFLLRLLPGGMLVLLLPLWVLDLWNVLLPGAWQSQMAYSLTYSFAAYFAVAGLTLLCFRLPLREAFYGTTCAYLTQHLAYCFHRLLFPQVLDNTPTSYNVGYLLVYGLVYLAAYYAFARHLLTGGEYLVKGAYSLATAVSALSVALVLSAVAQELRTVDGTLYPVCLLYAIACCSFVLWIQVNQKRRLDDQRRLDAQEQLWLQHKAQYEMTTENVELINRKCHDLKHQIAALRSISDQGQRDKSIQELEQSVMIYDSIVETGNGVLDTVLTEKSLLCEQRGITLTCMADGACLSFMDAVDIYALFGNALDNAIEAVSALEDEELRTIAVTVFARADLVFLQMENYYGGTLKGEGALPETTKEQEPGYHGFGLKSIRYTAEKYGGFLTVQTKDNIFLLRVTIPRYQS